MRRQRRTGFTLVELLVAMALTVFIMMILTQAFGTGMETFRSLRSVGALQSDLRNAAGLLKSDLDQSHFEGARRMSDAAFWQSPVREGFFFVSGGMVIPEGTGIDGLASATSTTQAIHFSRRSKGNRREQSTLASVPANSAPFVNSQATNICNLTADAQYTDMSSVGSQWSEIAWFLVQKPGSVSGLYSLYRTELLVVANNSFSATTLFDTTNYPSFSTNSAQKLLTAADLAKGNSSRGFRPGTDETAFANGTVKRATLVVDNILSFRVQMLRANDSDFVDVSTSMGGQLDTSNPGSNNQPIKAIKVTIRACDPANETTRQISMIQEL